MKVGEKMTMTMKTGLSKSVQNDINEVIGIILHEIELKDPREVGGVIPLQIESGKFGHPNDVPRIIDRINEREAHALIKTFTSTTFFEVGFDQDGMMTEETIAKLWRTRSITDLIFNFGEKHLLQVDAYFYLLIEDIDRLKKIKRMIEKAGISEKQQAENYLKSMYLVGDSARPVEIISLVLDEKYENPIRFVVKNKRGRETVMKKLYDIIYQYQFNIPDKKGVAYDERLAKSINNDLFKKPKVADYIKSNHFGKPKIVTKSPNGTLMLVGGTRVKVVRPLEIQSQYRSLYPIKTR